MPQCCLGVLVKNTLMTTMQELSASPSIVIDYSSENWVICERFPTYYISDYGRLQTRSNGNIKKLSINKKTNRVFSMLRNTVPGERLKKTVQIAPLVAQAFIGPRPIGDDGKPLQIHHINHDSTDNRVENLMYISQSDNIRAAYDEGFHPIRTDGCKNYLSRKQVKVMFKLSRQGLSQMDIAAIIGCCNSTVSKHLSGKIQFIGDRSYKKKSDPHREQRELRIGKVREQLKINPDLTIAEVRKLVSVAAFTAYKYLRELRGPILEHQVVGCSADLFEAYKADRAKWVSIVGDHSTRVSRVMREFNVSRTTARDAVRNLMIAI